MRGRAAAGEPCGRAAHGGGAGGMDLRRTSAARCGRYVAAMLALLACAFSAGSSWGRRAAIAPQLSLKEGLGRQAGPATDLAGGMLSTAQGGVFSPKPAATRYAVEDGHAEASAEDAATATSRAPLPPRARADAPIGSTLVGGLAPSSSARLEGAACASSPKQSDALHIAYAFEASGDGLKSQLLLVRQSAWTAYSTGCGSDNACRRNLMVHIFYNSDAGAAVEAALAPIVLRGLNLVLHPTDFGAVVTKDRTVWGYGKSKGNDAKLKAKLMTAANYFRFYIPSYLRRHFGAASMLYLDTDTVFLQNGLPALFEPVGGGKLPLATFGEQDLKNCYVGKMLLLSDKRLSGLGMKSADPCLAASVMLVNVELWERRGITERVEELLASNTKEKLWHLGSMPPLMVVMHKQWVSMGARVLDGKGSDCSSLQRKGLSEGILMHPFKSVCTEVAPPSATVCFDGGRKLSTTAATGSERIAAMHTHAIARLLGTEVTKGKSCDVMVAYKSVKDASAFDMGAATPAMILFKPDNSEGAALPTAHLVVADNDYMDQAWASRGQGTLRLHLVEDMRPTSNIQHVPRATPLGQPGQAAALLCYHGNRQHLRSLLPRLSQLTQSFMLRIMMGKSDIDDFRRAYNQAEAQRVGVPLDRIELKPYTAAAIYSALQDCDVGLAPTQVEPKVGTNEVALSGATETLFEAADTLAEDVVRRCKRTSNAGRMFVFMQLGVPTVTDACADSLRFSRHADETLALVAYRREMWAVLVGRLLDDADLRAELSGRARRFGEAFLTTRMQAARALDKLSCRARALGVGADADAGAARRLAAQVEAAALRPKDLGVGAANGVEKDGRYLLARASSAARNAHELADAARLGERGRALAWLHIPKCGTSLGALLYHYACPGLPMNATSLPCGEAVRRGAKPNCMVVARTVPYGNVEGARPVRKGYHIGNPQIDLVKLFPTKRWCPAARFANAEGKHQPLGVGPLSRARLSHKGAKVMPVITMLRRPGQRLMSAYLAGLHSRGMSHAAKVEMYRSVTTPAQFARTPGVAACQTKMLVGRNCAARHADSCRADGTLVGDAARAKRALVEQVAYFGLTDRWEESIALFHAMTGTNPNPELLRTELQNNRHTPQYVGDVSGQQGADAPGPHNEALLEGFVDERDEDLYAFAVQLFEERLRRYNISGT